MLNNDKIEYREVDKYHVKKTRKKQDMIPAMNVTKNKQFLTLV